MSSKSDNQFKILFFDLETAPNLGYTWNKWEQNVIEFTKEWYLLSFAVKWAGTSKTQVYALPDFTLYKTEPENDRELCKKLWELCNEADLLVAHNCDKFDVRKMNARLSHHGLGPPAPYKTVDTLKVARKYFYFNDNSLNALGKYLGLGEKVETGGFKLWLGCLHGDSKSWDKMKRYNKNDVVLLEKIYNKLRPWHTSHPNIAIKNDKLACPVCGGEKLKKDGWKYMISYKRQQYKCLNTACNRYSSGETQKLEGIKLR